jgi:hypothetical protein
MKRILTILALVAFTLPSGVATQQASAQIDKSPWYGVPTNPTSGIIPSGSADFKYPDDVHAKALEKIKVLEKEIALEQEKAKIIERIQAMIKANPPVVTNGLALPARIALPPAKYDGEFKGQVVITKWNDYSLIQNVCRDTPNAIACSYRTQDTASGKPISCLIMLGPAAHNNPAVLRHEIAHCNGWTNAHEGARYGD